MSSDWFTSSKSKDGGSLWVLFFFFNFFFNRMFYSITQQRLYKYILWVLPATQTFLFLGLCDVKAEQFFCLTIYKTAAVPYEEDLKYQTQDS